MATKRSLPPAEALEPAISAETALPPSAVQSLGGYLTLRWRRIRAGDAGVLPVVVAMVIIAVVFWLISPVFLTALNLTNLLQQSSFFVVFGMAEIFVLLLGEIDLSAGYVGGCAAVIGVQLIQPTTTAWPWWAAILAVLVFGLVAGAINGVLITRLNLPSFVVTLAGMLFYQGLMLVLLGLGPFNGNPSLAGTDPNSTVMYNLMWGLISPLWALVAAAVLVAVVGGLFWMSDSSRRRSGLVAPPVSITLAKIAAVALAAAAVVGILSINRSHIVGYTINGIPWVVPIVLGVLLVWTFLLQRTRFGRYIYAIGGNAEAARRAGVNLARIRTLAFMLCSMTAGIAGLLYAANLGGMSNNYNGGQLVLYAVAAAVIGGTSLFGGRGKALHGLLGGLVIGGIYNGMYLIGLDVQWQFMVTGGVLIAAVVLDALSRRMGAASGLR